MNYSIYRFTLDIHKTKSQVSIPVLYRDTGIKFYISLTDGGKPYIIEDGCRAVFSAKKPDGKELFNDCIIEDNTRIRYDFTAQTTNCEGMMNCEMRLYGKDGKLLTTPAFVVIVDPRVVYDSDILESYPESTTLDNIVSAENARVEGEQERVDAEAVRVIVENARAAAETERVTAENARVAAEGVRADSEKTRMANEAERVAAFAHMLGSWVAYSAYEDGTDYTYTWSEGQRYIGICNGKTPPADKTGFIWSKFVDTGIYIGGGEMPKWCNLQIDPDGEVTEIVQEPGQSDMNVMSQKAVSNTFANALKGNVSGEAVRIDDASPVTHDMSVKVSGVDDVSAVTVTARGKNFCNIGTVEVTAVKMLDIGSTLPPLANGKKYIFSFFATSNDTDANTCLVAFFTDDGTQVERYQLERDKRVSIGVQKIVGAKKIYLYASSGYSQSSGDTATFADIQIELADTSGNVTEYEPYVEPTEYAVNADGTVGGVTALYPTTTLTTDTAGAVLDVTYNRDANKVVNELTSRLAALESAVLK